MNSVHQGLLVLIKSALTGEKISLPEGFSLEAAEGLVHSQSLVPLIYRGAFNCGISPKSEIMQKYQLQYFQHLVSSDKQIRAVEQICAEFEKNGIDYMPLKGCNLKKLYPKPEMRSMGDADILIRLEQYEQIRPIMQQLRYEEKGESLHDLVWESATLYVELHKCIFAPNESDLYSYFGDGWGKVIPDTGCRYSLSREDEYIYIFTHMTKHFRFGGIGVRHLVDLYVYRRAYPDMNEVRIEQVLTDLRLLDFYRNIQRMLAMWFDDGPADEVAEMISDYVFSNGAFGTLEKRICTEELLKVGKKGEVKNSKLRSFIRALFPPLDRMQLSYNILYKWPVLYPFYWIVRWVDVLLHRRKNIGGKLQIIQNMTDEKVTAYERTMNLMGLDFDYGEEV